jgi:hypothetical protein
MTGIIECEMVPLRRAVLVIFVEFKIRIPEEFSLYLKQIPINHQQMIELYCSRKKNKL